MTLSSTFPVLARLRAWPVESQQRARRNAMVAATAFAQRRVERQEVEEFLASRREDGGERGGGAVRIPG